MCWTPMDHKVGEAINAMKPRARRVTLAAAVLGAGVVGALMVAPGPVRDHVEAWRFQLTRETETIEPEPASMGLADIWVETREAISYLTVDKPSLRVLASHLNRPVVFDPQEMAKGAILQSPPLRSGRLQIAALAGNGFKNMLQRHGFRILEQRIPRRAYVVIPPNQ